MDAGVLVGNRGGLVGQVQSSAMFDWRRLWLHMEDGSINNLPSAFWRDEEQLYHVTDAKLAADLLRAKEFDVVQIDHVFEQSSQNSTHGFEATTHYLRSVPLILRGEDHRESRAKAAQMIRTRGTLATDAFRVALGKGIGGLKSKPSQIDMVTQLIDPAVRAFTHCLSEIPEGLYEEASKFVSSFDPFMSLRNRYVVERDLGKYMNCPITSEQDKLANERIGMSTIAIDTLKGGIAYGLYNFLSRHIGERFAEMPWQDAAIGAPVKFTDRECVAPTELGGVMFNKGDRARVWLCAGDYNDGWRGKLVFSSGAHACSGARLAQTCFAAVETSFKSVDARLVSLDLVNPKNVFLTMSPKKMPMEILFD